MSDEKMALPEFMEYLENEIDNFESSLLAGLVINATKQKWLELFNAYIKSEDVQLLHIRF
jgi:hypothetical protein